MTTVGSKSENKCEVCGDLINSLIDLNDTFICFGLLLHTAFKCVCSKEHCNLHFCLKVSSIQNIWNYFLIDSSESMTDG